MSDYLNPALRARSVLPTVLCFLAEANYDRKLLVRALIDTGASRSCILRRAVEKLDAKIEVDPETSTVISTVQGEMACDEFVILNLLRKNDLKWVARFPAIVMDRITGIQEPVKISPFDLYPEMRYKGGLSDVFPRGRYTIELILGQDVLWLLMSGKTYLPSGCHSSFGLVFQQSVLGLIVQGSLPVKKYFKEFACANVDTTRQIEIIRQTREGNKDNFPNTECCVLDDLKDMWSLETLGISGRDSVELTEEDQYALENFAKTARYDKRGKKYIVHLTFKRNGRLPATNFPQAMARMKSVERQYKKDPVISQAYNQAIQDYIDRGDVEPAPAEILDGHCYYLPHHAVIRWDRETSKCRVVMDGSAKSQNGLSLNDCLEKGPNCNTDLLKILVRCRKYHVCIMGDITKMFLNVEIAEEYRDFLRFIWRDFDTESPPKHYRFSKVAFGILDSAFLAQSTVLLHADREKKKHPRVYQCMIEERWMDDLCTGADTVDEAVELIEEIDHVMKKASFHFRKWISNEPAVFARIPEPNRGDAPGLISGETDDPKNFKKVLGIQWNLLEDTFRFKNFQPDREAAGDPVTKREVASQLAKIFDPLGLLSPFTIRAKILFQQIWMASEIKNWDDPLTDDVRDKWDEWTLEIGALNEYRVPRCVFPYENETAVELHCFADASPYAYCAAVYVRVLYKDGGISSNLLLAKSRVAPINPKHTLPRLELLGALIAARLGSYVNNCWKTKHPVFCYTDSAIALHWIRQEPSKWKVFVARRVEEIQRLVPSSSWRHVPGHNNPADLGTRGISVYDLKDSKLWTYGPTWLTLLRSQWPSMPDPALQPSGVEMSEQEAKKQHTIAILQHVAAIQEEIICENADQDTILMPDLRYTISKTLIEKFSNFLTLLRVTVFVMRVFDKNMRHKDKFVRSTDYEKAILFLCKYVQAKHFEEEILALQKSRPISAKSKLCALAPFLDESGVVRVGGRLSHSDFDYDTKHPIILPDSTFLRSLIMFVHQKHKHMGAEWTLFNLRRQFWILKGRRTVKSVIKNCTICQRHNNPFLQQKMAPLPDFRTDRETRPFAHTGVDYAGPISVKPVYPQYEKKGKQVELIDNVHSSWICVFTCAVTRAVHIELVSDCSTECFLLAFRRFIARRGRPSHIISDNGTNFKGAAKELKLMYEAADKAIKTLQNDGIKWQFNCEKGAWWGGLFESMIKLIKNNLKKTISKNILTFEQLNTVLTEIEQILNSRPLATVSDSSDDPLPISPQMLLLGYRPEVLPSIEKIPDNVSSSQQQILTNWKHRMTLRNHFFDRLLKDYFLRLQQRSKWHDEATNIKVGEIVLVKQDKKPRRVWPLAKVIQTFEGRDKLVRAVLLKTESGVLRRPVQDLVHIEATEKNTLI